MRSNSIRCLAGAVLALVATVSPALAKCPSDLNADGRTDGTDLSVVLAGWGTCTGGSSCSGDINDDGLVNGTDLTALLAGWGPCPDPPCTGEYAWLPRFAATALTGTVNALTVFDDGSGPALYVGGQFTTAGGVEALRVAKWNGTSWSALGSGMSGGGVVDLTVFDDGSGPALYAGGEFTIAGGVSANRIAKWDGTSWNPLGSGMSSWVQALAVFDDGTGPALYAGGAFNSAGGVAGTSRIARWNGTSWSPVGGGMNNTVSALTVFDDGTGPALYAGGLFTAASGVAANRIAKWDGTSWKPLGSGIGNPSSFNQVYALTVFDDGSGPALYAGGAFGTAGGLQTVGIAKWSGTSWSPVGGGMNNTVSALTVFDDGTGPALYAGGLFTAASGVDANRIAKWDGTEWSPLGMGLNDYPWVLTVFNDGTGPGLYAGGQFTTAGGVSANNIAKWGCVDP